MLRSRSLLAATVLLLGCHPSVTVGSDDVAPATGGGGGPSAGGAPSGGGSAGAAGSSALPPIPARGAVVFSADMETGDLSQWETGAYLDHVASIQADPGAAHTGQWGVKTLIDPGGVVTQALSYQGLDLAAGFYSAWYYLPAFHDTAYWAFMKFSGNAQYFDLLFRKDSSGALVIALFDHPTLQTIEPASPPAVPIGQWFQIEVFYRPTPNPDGRLVIWQDGVLVLDTGERPTADGSSVAFGVGSVCSDPTGIFELWFDDVEVRAAL